MFKILPLLGFFNAFYSPLGMISYICGLKLFKTKLDIVDVLFIQFLLVTIISKALIFEPVYALMTFRFYFGFFCFYIYFKSGVEFPVKKLLLVVMLIVPLEALLINTIIPPQSMPNFPDASAFSHFNPGGYQRPYSFSGNASVSSAIMIQMLTMVSFPQVINMLFFCVVFIFASGVGFLNLFLVFIMKNIKLLFLFSSIIAIFILIFINSIINGLDSLNLKISSTYILFLIDFKLEQILGLFYGFSWVDYIFGNFSAYDKAGGYGGDFGWLFFILGYGFISFFVLVLYVLSKITSRNMIPLLLMLVITLHYPVMFFLPGQILIGYLMADKYRH